MKSHSGRRRVALASLVGTMIVTHAQSPSRPQEGDRQDEASASARASSSINVTATVTDASGRYVSGLRQDDFVVYEDDAAADDHALQRRTRAGESRASRSTRAAAWPVRSTGTRRRRSIASSTTCSIRDDEVFLYRFSNDPVLEQPWTTDRERVSGALRRIVPRGGTAMYDTVAEAVPLAQSGPQPQEGARRHLGRQRHELADRRLGGEAADPRDRGARVRDRDRRREPGVPERRLDVAAAACSCRGRSRARRRPSRPSPPPQSGRIRPRDVALRRPRERRRAARR